MLCAKYGLGQSADCPAQTSDPGFAQQSADWLRNPRIAPNEVCKAWISGQSSDCSAYPWIDPDQLARDKCGYLADRPGQSKILVNISWMD